MKNQYYPFHQSKQNHQGTPSNSISNSSEIRLAKIALFGNILAIIGEAIATYADFLALKELQQMQQNDLYEDRIKELEKQVQYLTKELQNQKVRKKF